MQIKGKVGELIEAITLASLGGGSNNPVMSYMHMEVANSIILVSQRDADKISYVMAKFKKFDIEGTGSIFFRTQVLLDYLKLASADDDFTIIKEEDNRFRLILPEDKDTIKEIQQEYDTYVAPKNAPFTIKDNIAYFTEEKPQTHVLINAGELKKLSVRNSLKGVLYYPLFFSPEKSYSEIAKYDPDKKGMKTKLTATVQGESGEICLGAVGDNLVSTISGDWNVHITKGYPAVWFFQENEKHKVGIVMALRMEGEE